MVGKLVGIRGVFVGGVIGSLLRLAVAGWLSTVPALLVVNLSGSLLLGVVVGWRLRSGEPGAWLVDFAAIGILGSFTTFSAFAVAVIEGPAAASAIFAVGSVAAGLVLVRIGVAVGGRW